MSIDGLTTRQWRKRALEAEERRDALDARLKHIYLMAKMLCNMVGIMEAAHEQGATSSPRPSESPAPETPTGDTPTQE